MNYIFWRPSVLTQCFDELMFADDPKVKPDDRRRSESMGRFGFVKQGEMRGGILSIAEDTVCNPRRCSLRKTCVTVCTHATSPAHDVAA